MSRLNLAVAAISVGGLLAAPGFAQAHFILNAPTNWWNQNPSVNGGGAPQKIAPCGSPASEAPTLKATNVVNVYQPGQPVTITVTTTVAHFGWWRVSLHEGAASTQTTTTLPDPTPTTAMCVTPFIDNPVWSPTQPVIADKLGIPAGSSATNVNQSGTLNFQVTIPQNAHCSMASPCTLQVIMIMTTDHAPPNCFYHHCADMALASSTGGGGSTGTTDAGTSGQGGATAGTGGTGAGGSTSSGIGGSTAGTAGMTGGNGSGGAMAGSAGANGDGGSTTTGAGGASSGGSQGGTTGGGGSKDSGGGCAIGGSTVGSSSGLILLAVLGLRRRRARK
jgi:hypothetical protein